MKNIFLLIFLAFSTQIHAQVNIVDTGSYQGYQVYQNGVYRSTQPKGETFIDVDATGKLSIKQMSGVQVTQYFTFSNYRINGNSFATFQGAIDTLGIAIGWVNSGGSGSGIQSIIAGDNITVDATDPQNPVISATGGGESVNIYNSDGTADAPRVAEFPFGVTFSNPNTGTVIALQESETGGNGSGIANNRAGIYVSGGNAVMEGDSLTFSHVEGDTANIHFFNLPYLSNPAFNLGVDVTEISGDYKYKLYRTNTGGSGDLNAANGTYKDGNTVKLGGDLTETTVIEMPDTNTYFQIGNDGNALNIKKPVPVEFQDIAKEFSGFDFTENDAMAVVGTVWGVTVADIGFEDETIIGSLSVVGDFVSGDYTIYVTGIRVSDAGNSENISVAIVYSGGDILSVNAMSVNPSTILFTHSNIEVTLNNSGISISDGTNSLLITPESILVPSPPPSGNYVLKSIGGSVNWEEESAHESHIVSASTFEIIPVKSVYMLTLTGTITEAKLPPIAGNDGLIIFITNAGTSTSDIISNSGGNDIWEGGMYSNSSSVVNGTVMRLINDGVSYRVL